MNSETTHLSSWVLGLCDANVKTLRSSFNYERHFLRSRIQVSISSTFYVQIFRTMVHFCNFFLLHVRRKSCQNGHLYEKFVRRMLMKLIAGFNFINIMRAPFLYQSIFSSFSLVTVGLWNFFAQKYWRKSCS